MTTHHSNEIDPQDYVDMGPPLNIPDDPLADTRAELQRKYNYQPIIDATYDAVAKEIYDHFHIVPGRGVAGVNHLDEHRHQVFVGVWGADLREMNCHQGACSTNITRQTVKGRTALAMGDLMYFPLFATNDMVTVFEMRTYLGAQIITPEGVPIGTVWWIDTEPRQWTQDDLDFMKSRARKVMNMLLERLGR